MVSNTQTLEFKVIVNHQVQDQTTHLAIDYERLNVEMAKFRQLIIEMRSWISGAYASYYSSHSLDEDLPSPPLSPLF